MVFAPPKSAGENLTESVGFSAGAHLPRELRDNPIVDRGESRRQRRQRAPYRAPDAARLHGVRGCARDGIIHGSAAAGNRDPRDAVPDLERGAVDVGVVFRGRCRRGVKHPERPERLARRRRRRVRVRRQHLQVAHAHAPGARRLAVGAGARGPHGHAARHAAHRREMRRRHVDNPHAADRARGVVRRGAVHVFDAQRERRHGHARTHRHADERDVRRAPRAHEQRTEREVRPVRRDPHCHVANHI